MTIGIFKEWLVIGRWPEPWNFKTSHFRILYSFPSRISALCLQWHVFYIRNRHISVSSFVYKYDQWPHDSCMIERAGAWEADDIVSSILYSPSGWFGRWPEPWNFKTSHFRILYSFPSRISALFLLHTKTDNAILLTAKVECTAKWHVFYIRNRHISVSSFVYKYDQWPHDSYMTGMVSTLKKTIKSKHNFESGNFQTFYYFI
jgi:hypothetical protein